jgi:hypothetical protein
VAALSRALAVPVVVDCKAVESLGVEKHGEPLVTPAVPGSTCAKGDITLCGAVRDRAGVMAMQRPPSASNGEWCVKLTVHDKDDPLGHAAGQGPLAVRELVSLAATMRVTAG